MRSAPLLLLLVVVASACGRLGFDAAAHGGDAGPGDGAPGGDAAVPPALACGETKSAGAAAITGSGLEAVVTPRGLAAFWLDTGGALYGVTWQTDAGGGVIAQDPV